MRFKSVVLFIAISLIVLPAFAQEYTPMVKADNVYQSGKYMDAIELYKKAFFDLNDKQYQKVRHKKEMKAKMVFQIAECYRMLEDPKMEEPWYRKAIQMKCADSIAAKQYIEATEKQIPKYNDTVIKYNQYAKPQGYYDSDSIVPKRK